MTLSNILSAIAENETYMNSIQGRIDQFTNSLQTMWMNFISSDLVKWVVDAGTTIIQWIDKIGVGWSALIATISTTALKKYGKDILSFFDFKGNAKNIAAEFMAPFTQVTKEAVTSLSQFSGQGLMDFLDGKTEASNIKDIASALREEIVAQGAVSEEVARQILLKHGVAEADIAGTLSAIGYTGANATLTFSFEALGAAIKKAAIAFWNSPFGKIAIIGAIITGVVKLLDILITTHDEYVEKLDETSEELKSVRSEIESLNDELKTTQDRIDELNGNDKLTFTEKEELAKLQAQTAELERQLELQKALEKAKQKEVAADFENVVESDNTINKSDNAGILDTQLRSYEEAQQKENDARQKFTEVINSGADENSKEYKDAQKNLEKATAERERIGTGLTDTLNNYTGYLNTEGVEWQFVEYDENGNAKELEAWQKQMNEYLQRIYDNQDRIAIAMGNTNAKDNALTRIFGMTGAEDEGIQGLKTLAKETKDTQAVINALAADSKLQAYFTGLGISAEDVASYLLDVNSAAGAVTSSIDSLGNSLSSYSDTISKFQSLQDILNESVYEGMSLTDEQGSTLKELIGSMDGYSDAIDTSNGYVVKNVALLKKLVAQRKAEQQATIRSNKAYAQLKYKTLISNIANLNKQMRAEYKNKGKVTDATLKQISAARDEIKAIKDTIKQYSLLELQLSDAANAYKEFEDAKNFDAQLTYGDSMIEAIEALNEGFISGEVGTETFQAAVDLIVPPEVYEGIDNYKDRLIAIHDYVDKNPLFADWFTIDEDGNFEITYDNIEKFVEDCQNLIDENGNSIALFTQDNASGEFFLAEGINNVEDFADALGTTDAVALAMLTELSKYDATWSDLLTQLTTTPLDRAVLDATDALDEALAAQEAFIRSGAELEGKEWDAVQQNVTDAQKALDAATKAAEDNAAKVIALETLYAGLTGSVKLSKDSINALLQTLGLANGTDVNITVDDEGNIKLAENDAATLNALWTGLDGSSSEMHIQTNYDEIVAQIDELQKYINNKLNMEEIADIKAKYNITNQAEAQALIDDILNPQKNTIELQFGITQTTEQKETDAITKLQEWEANGVKFTVSADNSEANAAVEETNEKVEEFQENASEPVFTIYSVGGTGAYITNTIANQWDSITGDKSTTYTVRTNWLDPSNPNSMSGFGSADGTAHASGNWGLKEDEKGALVGELGTELVKFIAR